MIINRWLSRLRQYRQDELPANVADWPQDWQEEYEEQVAAILGSPRQKGNAGNGKE